MNQINAILVSSFDKSKAICLKIPVVNDVEISKGGMICAHLLAG